MRIIFLASLVAMIFLLTMTSCPYLPPPPYDDSVPIRGDYSVTGITDTTATFNYHLAGLASGEIFVYSQVVMPAGTGTTSLSVATLMEQYLQAGAVPGVPVGSTDFMILPDSVCGEALECEGPSSGYFYSTETTAFQKLDFSAGIESRRVAGLRPDTWYQCMILANKDVMVGVRPVLMVFKTLPGP